MRTELAALMRWGLTDSTPAALDADCVYPSCACLRHGPDSILWPTLTLHASVLDDDRLSFSDSCEAARHAVRGSRDIGTAAGGNVTMILIGGSGI